MKFTFLQNIIWGVLSLVLLPVTSFAQGVAPLNVGGCISPTDTAIADVLHDVDSLVTSVDTACDLYFSDPTPTDGGWNVKYALVCASGDTGTVFVPICGAVFDVREIVVEARSDNGLVQVSIETRDEDGNNASVGLEYQGSDSRWHLATQTWSKGAGNQRYTLTWAPKVSGRYALRAVVTDHNGNRFLSNSVEVSAEVPEGYVVYNNGTRPTIGHPSGDVVGSLEVISLGTGQAIGAMPVNGPGSPLPTGLYGVKGVGLIQSAGQ